MSRPLRPLIAVTVLLAVLVGAGGVLALHAERRSTRVVHPTGLELTAAETHGRQLFAGRCATCHTLAAVGAVGKVGPNLDIIAPYGLDAGFVHDTILNGMVRGNGTMPAGIYSDPDASDVAAFLAADTRDEAAGPSRRAGG